MLRIWFFWTPHLSAQVLRDFIEASDMEVVFVVTSEDKAIGRHQVVTPNGVKTLAIEHDIPVHQPARVRGNNELFTTLAAYDADYFVVVAYGKIVPREILDMPRKYCLNIHGSILPKYRGASPIQSALLEWERETWVTIMTMSEGMDEGDIVDILTFPIAPDETAGTLFERYGEVSGQFAIETIRKLDAGILAPRPQDNTLATYCTKIHKEDGFVDWSMDADTIYHRWQGFTPWPGIFTMYEGKRLVIEECGYIDSSSDDPIGTVIRLADTSIGVVCGKWTLTLKRVKLEWKKSQSVEEFANGHRGFVKSILKN